MKILEHGQVPEDQMAGMQHVGKSFRCPTCSTVIQIEASDIEFCKRHDHACHYDYERYAPCPTCKSNITFSTDELIHEDVTPPSWEEVRSTLHKEILGDVKRNWHHPDTLQRQYESAVMAGDEDTQERILREIWENNHA